MSSFWKFIGGLLVGAVAMKVANDYYKDQKPKPKTIHRGCTNCKCHK